MTAETQDDDDTDAALVQARTAFVSDFEPRCATIASLIGRVCDTGEAAAAAELSHVLHRIGGIGGTIGLPTVSARARDFEDMVRDARDTGFDADAARRQLQALRDAFRHDVSR